ncbi:MAG: hypothetical protein ACTSRS_09070 [Candidatus Helarchaeota archaeon]
MNLLTINEAISQKDDLIEFIFKAFEYFPKGLWTEVNYHGNIDLHPDVRLKTKDKEFGALLFTKLLQRIRGLKHSLHLTQLLLAVTHDPVVGIYYNLELEKIRQRINLVYDFVSRDIGVVSLFELEDEAAVKVAAHGLGHNQQLPHHLQPIDLMYINLLKGPPLETDGFCENCLQKMKSQLTS